MDRAIQFHYFQLFVYLCMRRFQIPLPGLSQLRKRWQHLDLFVKLTHFFKIWLRSFAAYVDLPSISVTINLCSHAQLRAPVKISVVSTRFMSFIGSGKGSVTPSFLVFLAQITQSSY